MTDAEKIIAKLAAEHMPKPAHNMFAVQVRKALADAGYVIIKDRMDPEGGTPGRS
ncbi:MAG: hypothetical protein KIT48_09325 [Pseudolabrys sp.]|nr:hypothetical protein [Pseudolabrys sp.]